MPEYGPGHDPVDNVIWQDASALTANNYNPNVVMNAELRLLERSIVLQGWTQSIWVNKDGIIIDGFHRWRLAQESDTLKKRYGGKVPTLVFPVTEAEAMMMTVRINRAKGTHVAVRMSDLVRSLVEDHDYSVEEICLGIGANEDEVKLLLTGGLKKSRKLDKYRYSEAWKPIETRHRKAKAAEETEEFERETDD